MILQRAFYRPVALSARSISSASKVGESPFVEEWNSKVGESPPPLEKWDPLNPGKWQLGAKSKLVPRLPEGARVGNLVMGKYGLYSPSQLRHSQNFGPIWEASKIPEDHYPPLKKWVPLNILMVAISMIIGIWNIASLMNSKLLWPFSHHKCRG